MRWFWTWNQDWVERPFWGRGKPIPPSLPVAPVPKNFESVAVVTDPASYDAILEEMRANGGATTRETRQKLALRVFQTTGAYDTAIAEWMEQQI